MKLYENYPNIIQTYREQAELADKSPEHRTTIRLADRLDFGDDSISMENLCLERSHPDAIGSVIHGQLHKNLALNHVGKENGQILPKNHKIIFLDSVPKAKNKAECQEPHDEMQILRYWKDMGIL
ncbi:unnamed protein product [Adineta steineri]|uniref:Uncharacterized protein n=1 Tax=Adineta steineri TaxID=433720 RepID=A0A818MBG8_9BILA|nr:unnamed protein product [Adineta steineri]